MLQRPAPPLSAVLSILFALTASAWCQDSVVTFNEVHYNPPGEGDALEFIELLNQCDVNVDMSGWTLRGGADFDFPEGTVITGGKRIVIAADPEALTARGVSAAIFGPWRGKLSNGGEELRLRERNGRTMDTLAYNDKGTWPSAPDGTGATLAKSKPLSATADSRNWRASWEAGGTPGAANFSSAEESIPEIKDGVGRYYNADLNNDDVSGNGFAATVSGTRYTVQTPPQIGEGSAYSFDGTNDYVQVLDPVDPNSYTIAAWVTPDNIRAQSIIVRSASAGPRREWSHQLRMTAGGSFEHYASDGSGKKVTGTTVPVAREWVHVAITARAGGELKLFVNGVQEGGATAIGDLWEDGDRWRFGSNSGDSMGYFDGKLDEIAIWHWELKPEDIAKLASGEIRPPAVEPPVIIGNPEPSVDPSTVPVRISEIAAGGTNPFWIELENTSAEAFALDDFVIATTGGGELKLQGVTVPAAGLLRVGLAFAAVDGERIALYTPAKTGIVHAGRLRTRGIGWLDGGFKVVAEATPGAANVFSFSDAVVINEIMYSHRPQYRKRADPDSLKAEPIFAVDTLWRHDQSGEDLGTAWREPGFADAAWPEGPGILGRETSDLEAPILTPLAIGSVTYYFRKTFTADAAAVQALRMRLIVDDGAVIYLNGQEVVRVRMPDGAPTFDLLAADGVSNASYESFEVPIDALVDGENVLAVEVHQERQGSSDVAFGMELDAFVVEEEGDRGQPYVPSDEEWIELYNRSAEAVDLSGWKLRDAVDYVFPDGTLLQPDSYLVVSNDATALKAKWPAASVVGDFSGTLSNRGELLTLVDGVGNPADQVYYQDDFPWPTHPDGGGSSLELRNPDADNTAAAAWSESTNPAAEWRDYSFTMTAVKPKYTATIRRFHELRMGLNDAGELLLDDVSVIEDPLGANRELMQNGGFDSGTDAWRIVGTHDTSSIVDDGGNAVLHVVANGPLSYVYNVLETSLKADGSLVPVDHGTDYKISFRAKWLHGSPQFHAELYYNKVSKTLILDQPEAHGTPGARNSTYEESLPPTYANFRHSPAVPEVDEPITVSIEASDPDGVKNLTLIYDVDRGGDGMVPMTLGSDGVWSAQIPGESRGTVIQFYVSGEDNAGQQSFHPAAGPASRALVKVQDGRFEDGRQNLRIIMIAAEASRMHNAEEIMSNQRRGCTIIYNDAIHYDCGIRLRGSMFSRNNSGSTGLNMKFPADRRFRGVHKTITTRKNAMREIIVKHMNNHAGGIHSSYNDLVYQAGHTTAQNGFTRLEMLRFGEGYTDNLPGEGRSGGTVFKMEGIRDIQASRGNDPEREKLPFPVGWISNFDLADQGDDHEHYRHNIKINSNRDDGDYTQVVAMCKAIGMRGDDLDAEIPKILDVDAWMRQFAMLSLAGIGDTYTQGNPHNLNFYVRPGDGKVESMPWDWDFTFNRGATSALWGGRNFANVIRRPKFERVFYGHMLDLVETTFNEEYMSTWLSHLGTKAGESFTGNLSYIRSRVNHVTGSRGVPEEFPFEAAASAASVDGPTGKIAGKGWFNVKDIYANGEPLDVTWLDDEQWEASVALQPGANAIAVTAIDYQGREVAAASVTVTNTSTIASPSPQNVVISEIHYNPSDGGVEFLELRNISDTAMVDLSGAAFTNGVAFTFSAAAPLAPGEFVLVVADAEAFAQAYGAGLPVAGAFESGQLSNGGERIVFSDAGGSPVWDFDYNDREPWPTAADGGGASLVLVDPAADPSNPESWVASSVAGGTPGSDDTGAADLVDADGDGLVALLEQAFGTSDAVVSPEAIPTLALVDGEVQVTIQRDTARDDLVLTFERSADLETWEAVNAELKASNALEGTIVSETSGLGGFAAPTYYRVSVTKR